MNNAVLFSIKPKYCEQIISGKKTVEVRKKIPKISVPFPVYIYETKGRKIITPAGEVLHEGRGKVIGEFVCDEIIDIHYHEEIGGYGVAMSHPLCDFFAESTCLTFKELHNYLQGNTGYGLHISDLVIYDKPKELNKFVKIKKCPYGNLSTIECSKCDDHHCLTRPPQSWCYVEELGDEE